MAADKQRGLKRLALALGIPWALWWGYQALETLFRIRSYQAARAEWAKIGLKNIDGGHMLEALQATLTTDVAWLMAPFLIAAAAYWVYRGFRRQ